MDDVPEVRDGDDCVVVGGTHAGKSGIVEDSKLSDRAQDDHRASGQWRTLQDAGTERPTRGLKRRRQTPQGGAPVSAEPFWPI